MDEGAEHLLVNAQAFTVSDIITMLAKNPGCKIACFGSRETPAPVLEFMKQLGAFLARQGFFIASGHCTGADWWWEQGVNEGDPTKMIICLPWASYNRRAEDNMPIDPKNKIWSFDQLNNDLKKRLMDEAAQHHPVWKKLKETVKPLMARNIMIASKAVFGLTYLNHSQPGGGGSGQAYRYLRSKGAPVWDLSLGTEKWEKVIQLLSQV